VAAWQVEARRTRSSDPQPGVAGRTWDPHPTSHPWHMGAEDATEAHTQSKMTHNGTQGLGKALHGAEGESPHRRLPALRTECVVDRFSNTMKHDTTRQMWTQQRKRRQSATFAPHNLKQRNTSSCKCWRVPRQLNHLHIDGVGGGGRQSHANTAVLLITVLHAIVSTSPSSRRGGATGLGLSLQAHARGHMHAHGRT
jgi:hypothetical protein